MKQIFIDERETTYFVNEEGRVLNKKTNNWLKGTVKQGYRVYELRHNKKKYSKLAHRLVAEYFLDNPNNLPYVNHKDGNKLNNKVNNLEWCTPAENIKHAYNTGLKEKNNGVSERIKYTSDLDNEIWKQYKNTVYMISNKGRVRNVQTNNLIKGKMRCDGYIEWHFRIEGKSVSLLAHRIVYEVFNGFIEDGLVINHIDGNKTNNQLSNLEKISVSDNINHAYYVTKVNPKIKTVGKYTLDDELLEVYPSCAEAARQNIDTKANLIVNVCNGKKHTHHGYKWKYIDKE